jgi:hypothetical protein
MPRPGMMEAYKTVLAQTYRSITSKERDGRKVLKNELDQIQTRISKARELLLSDDLDAADYKTIKQEGEGRITALEAKLFSSPAQNPNIEALIDKILDSLCRLDKLYKEGDLKRKHIIIGSIFPERLTFNGFYYRTTRINEAIQLIYMMSRELDENKNGQPEENFELSIPVARPGLCRRPSAGRPDPPRICITQAPPDHFVV